jgi:diguanylate cyclase (GGDEF)-like protein/PAS domain S-box-containing protein
MERGLQEQHDLLRVTLESVADAVATTDENGRVRILNSIAEELTGWTGAEAEGLPVEAVIALCERRSERHGGNLAHPAYPAYGVLSVGRKIEKTDSYLLVSRDGRRLAIELSVAAIRNTAGETRGCVLVFRDVSQARQMADRMSYQAHHDPLTGLPNRILLVDRLEQGARLADRNSDRLAVMFLDLDHFKEIRDEYGAGPGDELLKEASFRLRAALRESDTVCRLGAGEFVVVLPGVKQGDDIEGVAAKLLAEMAKPFRLGDGMTVETSCSIGVSVYPQHGNDVGTLMRLADGAMYTAKRKGRNLYSFATAGVEPTEFAENPDPPDFREQDR